MYLIFTGKPMTQPAAVLTLMIMFAANEWQARF